jgi:hypothetical protein
MSKINIRSSTGKTKHCILGAMNQYKLITLETMVKVLGETFSIKERKLRTQGIPTFTNTTLGKNSNFLELCTPDDDLISTPEDGLIIRKYIRVLSKCSICETYTSCP